MRFLRFPIISTLILAGGFCLGQQTSSGPALGASVLSSSNQAQVENWYAQYRSQVQANIELLGSYPELAEIGNKLGAAAGYRHPVQIEVFRSQEVNAFMIGPGPLYISTALVDRLDDNAELAACVAHFLGHVVAGHSERQLSPATIADPNTVPLVFLDSANRLRSPINTAVFTKGMETEADSLALRFLRDAGYDPSSLVRFSDAIVHADAEGKVAKRFLAHTVTGTRRESVTANLAAMTSSAANSSSGTLASLKTRLRSQPVETRTATAIEIYEKWRTATNLDTVKAHRSIKVTTKVAPSGERARIESCEATSDGAYRRDDLSGILISTNVAVTKRNDLEHGKIETSRVNSRKENEPGQELLACLPALLPKFPANASVLDEAFGSRPAYRITVRWPGRPADHEYYVDKQTYMYLGTKYRDEVWAYSDFRRVDSATIPFRTYFYSAGVEPYDSDDRIQSVDYDSVEAADFDVARLKSAKSHVAQLSEKRPPLSRNGSSGGFWNSFNNVVQSMQQQQAAGPDPMTAASQQATANMEVARQQAAMRDEMRRQEQERQREAESQRQADEERRREARQEAAEARCMACTSAPDVARYEAECKSAGGGAQAPCYRAAAALCSCQIAAGGCGSSLSSLQQCVSDNNGLADYLKSNAPTFGRGGSSSSGGNGSSDAPQKFEWVSQRCAKHWGNAAETACMHFESREKCEGYKGQPCVRDTSKIPPGAAIPAITDQY